MKNAFRLCCTYRVSLICEYEINMLESMISIDSFQIMNRYPVNSNIKDFPKERYNTYAKSCNSNLYTKYPGATYSGLLLGTMRCL